MEILTFNDLVTKALQNTSIDNIINGLPWYFKYKDLIFTHETDDCYIINTYYKFFRNDILVITDQESFIYRIKCVLSK